MFILGSDVTLNEELGVNNGNTFKENNLRPIPYVVYFCEMECAEAMFWKMS
jgi:hypothetical protein